MILNALEVIMEENLKIMHLNVFVMSLALNINSFYLGHHNKIESLREKSRSIQEMASTMLNENTLLKYFWVKTVNITYYVLNRVLIRPYLNKTLYELWKDRKHNIGYLKAF